MDSFRSGEIAPRAPDAASLAQELDGALRTCQALLQAGRPLDLAGLEAKAGRLCAACLDLPPEQGQAWRQPLANILARLDLVEATMRLAHSGT